MPNALADYHDVLERHRKIGRLIIPIHNKGDTIETKLNSTQCGFCRASSSAILAMRPVRHRPQGPCSQQAPNMKAGIQYSYSLPTHYDCCPTFNALYQGSANIGSGSRNNLNLHFKFAILIRQNKYNHVGLLFHMLTFVQFCARKLLLSIVCLLTSSKIHI